MKPNAQFLYTIKPTRLAMLTEGPTPDEARITDNHITYLENMAEKGIVFLAGRTQTSEPDTFGIVMINLDDEAAAREVMENDPAVKHGVMAARLYPYRIAVFSQTAASD